VGTSRRMVHSRQSLNVGEPIVLDDRSPEKAWYLFVAFMSPRSCPDISGSFLGREFFLGDVLDQVRFSPQLAAPPPSPSQDIFLPLAGGDCVYPDHIAAPERPLGSNNLGSSQCFLRHPLGPSILLHHPLVLDDRCLGSVRG